MRPLLRYVILLLVGGIIIPICHLTFLHLNRAPGKPAAPVQNALPINEKRAPGFSFKDDVAAKLLPVLKYF